MAGYHASLEHIIKRAEIGLQQRNNTNATGTNNTVPHGTWEKRNNHFFMESLDYTLLILKEVHIVKGRAIYLVQQSHPVNGQKRVGLMYVEDFGRPTQKIEIDDSL